MTRFLENSNNFDIENVLEETTDNWFDGIIIYKIIEIKDNEIVSISNKYMIKFKLNKKNKYLYEIISWVFISIILNFISFPTNIE